MINNKKGFTLIELLAVIIILGILMIIAIPSVTRYISDSRKTAYIDTAKQVASATKNLVNSGKLEMYDTNVAYYIPNTCIKIENGEKAKSSYGEFIDDRTYVIVTYDGKGYDYYWVSLDDTGIGVKEPINIDKLEEKDLETDLTKDDIKDNNGVGKEKVVIFNSTCDGKREIDAYSDVLCKRATTLHKKECKRNSYGCRVKNNYSYGDTIEYGNLGTKGTLNTGDAFDCDINGDGEFDEDTERFYYISSSGDIASLIYYKNYINYIGDYSNLSDINEIDSSVSVLDNIHGPLSAMKKLPTTSEWSSDKLISGQTRNITNEVGTKTTLSGDIIQSFTYSDKAARFMTYQEVQNACGNTITNEGNLNNCNYLLENTQYDGGNVALIWLETPQMNSTDKAWVISGYESKTIETSVNTSYCGFRPVIDVKISKIEY